MHCTDRLECLCTHQLSPYHICRQHGYNAGFRSCEGASDNDRGFEGTPNDHTPSQPKSDAIERFCEALNRGDYVAAEGFLGATGYGSLALGARLGCGLIELANSLED